MRGIQTRFLSMLAVGFCGWLGFAASTNAATVFSVTESSLTTSSSASQRTLWENSLSALPSVDNLNGLACVVDSCSTASNTFMENDPSTDLSAISLGGPFGVVDGTALRAMWSSSPPLDFIWTLGTPSNAFAFNYVDNDGGIVTIDIFDGATLLETYVVNAFSGENDNSFWGISGLGTNATSVRIRTTDTGGVTYWDNFSVGVSAIPIPAALPLFFSALAFFGIVARKRRQGAAAAG